MPGIFLTFLSALTDINLTNSVSPDHTSPSPSIPISGRYYFSFSQGN